MTVSVKNYPVFLKELFQKVTIKIDRNEQIKEKHERGAEFTDVNEHHSE